MAYNMRVCVTNLISIKSMDLNEENDDFPIFDLETKKTDTNQISILYVFGIFLMQNKIETFL